MQRCAAQDTLILIFDEPQVIGTITQTRGTRAPLTLDNLGIKCIRSPTTTFQPWLRLCRQHTASSPGRNSMNWACCFDNQHVAAKLHVVDAASTRARPAVGLHMQSVLSSSLSFHTLEFGRHTVEGQASSQGGRGQVWSDSCKSYSAEQQGSGCCYGLLAFMTKTRGCKRLTHGRCV